MKIMTSGPITSWQIEGEKVETRFYFLGLQNITVDGDYLLVGRKSMTNIEKDITLLTKV